MSSADSIISRYCSQIKMIPRILFRAYQAAFTGGESRAGGFRGFELVSGQEREKMIKTLLLTVLISMVPVMELRVAIPMAVGMGIHPPVALAAAVVGNMIPVPFIIIFIRRVFDWLRPRSALTDRFVTWVEKHARKNEHMIYKYRLLGLFIVVAVPLPGTGAWTGALLATLMDIRLKWAVPVIFAGVATAGVIMCIVSYGVKTLF